jgi:hypothetical protein
MSLTTLFFALAAFIVGYVVPRSESLKQRVGVGLISALTVAFIAGLWPDASAPQPAADSGEWPYLLTFLIFTPLVASVGVLFLPRQGLKTLRYFTYAAMGLTFVASLWLLARADDGRLALPVHQGVDPGPRHPLPRRARRHQPVAGPAHHVHHAHRGVRVVRLDQDADEGALLRVPAPGSGHARRVRRARPVPLLRVLGADARADVPDDRHLGRRREDQGSVSSSSSTPWPAAC